MSKGTSMPQSARLTVTTSWDDGVPTDVEMARQLVERGLRGTFYVADSGWADQQMADGEIRVEQNVCHGLNSLVLTTDIDTRHLERLGLPNVEVHRHDIGAEALPGGPFDLAYARMVLEHLPAPDVALARMAASLRPGGWLDLPYALGTMALAVRTCR